MSDPKLDKSRPRQAKRDRLLVAADITLLLVGALLLAVGFLLAARHG